MHHDVSAPVARLLAGVRARPPWRHRSGLTLVPLDDARGPRWTGLPSVRSELEVGETVPPRPGALLVANRGPGAVAVHTGDLFTGGLADRAAQAAALVGPGEEQVVSVEAVEARWWWTGPPVLRGTLDPPLAALVALAGLDREGRGGLSAIARTGLWLQPERRGGPADVALRADHRHKGLDAALRGRGPRTPGLERAASGHRAGSVAVAAWGRR